MVERLPEDLSRLNGENLRRAVKSREERLTPLFRRWPRLTKLELRELKQLYQERLRVAKYRGRNR